MPPIVVFPLVKLALGALGAGIIVHWVVKEVRRINTDLDRVKTGRAIDPVNRQAPPIIRPPPRLGQ